MYNIIATGSKGNCVIYHKKIMVDCGVPYSKIKEYVYDIQLILLTHEHKDHINITTLKKIQSLRPSIRIGCCSWFNLELRNVDVYEIGNVYNYGSFSISPIKLYHDVPNCGYRIFKDEYKIIHATDTAHLEGIEAIGYDLYAIEHNYDEDTVFDLIEEKKARGEFAYQEMSINAHLSEQKAREFIYKNKSEKSEVIRLHETTLL